MADQCGNVVDQALTLFIAYLLNGSCESLAPENGTADALLTERIVL